MNSNIEPLAREMAMRICRRSGMAEDDIPRWVDLTWPCAAAMLESGVMNEAGEWVEDARVRQTSNSRSDSWWKSRSVLCRLASTTLTPPSACSTGWARRCAMSPHCTSRPGSLCARAGSLSLFPALVMTG